MTHNSYVGLPREFVATCLEEPSEGMAGGQRCGGETGSGNDTTSGRWCGAVRSVLTHQESTRERERERERVHNEMKRRHDYEDETSTSRFMISTLAPKSLTPTSTPGATMLRYCHVTATVASMIFVA